MEIDFTERFLRSYGQLTPKEQQAIDRAVDMATKNLRYPGLRAKKIQGAGEDVWELRASRDLRVTSQVFPDKLLFRNCGHHKVIGKL